MGTIAWLLLGGIAGWIASIIMKTDASQGVVLNVVVGIIGAVLGGWLFDFFGGSGVTGLDLYSLGVAVVGAVVLIWLVKLVRG